MSETSAIRQIIFSDNPTCTQRVLESKWTDAALLISAIAFLIIAILATFNFFDLIGTTAASNLSYGFYAGASLLFAAEVIKNCMPKPIKHINSEAIHTDEDVDSLIQKIELATYCMQRNPGIHPCKITLTNGQVVTTRLSGHTGYLLLNAIHEDKIYSGERKESKDETLGCFDPEPDHSYKGKNAAKMLRDILNDDSKKEKKPRSKCLKIF